MVYIAMQNAMITVITIHAHFVSKCQWAQISLQNNRPDEIVGSLFAMDILPANQITSVPLSAVLVGLPVGIKPWQ